MNSKKTILGSRTGRLGTVGALCALMACPTLAQDNIEDDQPVQVTDYGTVTLAVQDTDLAQVLEMLSIQSQKNIITSRNVSATISANLYDVTFYEALDSILKVNGYDYREEGNFIYIYTQAEIEEIELAQMKAESRIFDLNYLSASDANELIAPLLSETGKSSFRGDVQPGIEPDSSDAGQDNWAFTAMLVVNDFPDNLTEIANLLAELDVPPKQVLIESTILQTTLNEKNAFGIDFSFVSSVNFNDLTNPLSGVSDLLNGSGGIAPDNEAMVGSSNVANIGDPGTFKLGIINDDFTMFLRALDQVSDTTILARPKVMCLNRQRAEVLVGRRVGYLSTTATETSSTQTVEFLDTGIHLMFRPFISSDGMIRLELAPSVSDFVLREVAGSGTTKVTIPDEVTNELTTNVRIKDGQTLVLGGLYRESNDVKRRQVPILGDIPLVGAAFRGQDDEVKMDEIIFLITPSVVQDDLLWSMGDSATGYTDSVQVGARSGLLPFSRSRMSEGYNHRAMDAFNEGQFDQALYFLNDSLRINPNQPSMIRMRERINGVKEKAYERNQLERIMRMEMGDSFSSVWNTPSGNNGVTKGTVTSVEPNDDDDAPSLKGIESESWRDTPDGPLNSVSTYTEGDAAPTEAIAEVDENDAPFDDTTSELNEFASRDTNEITIDEIVEDDFDSMDAEDEVEEAMAAATTPAGFVEDAKVEDVKVDLHAEEQAFNDAVAASEAETAALAEAGTAETMQIDVTPVIDEVASATPAFVEDVKGDVADQPMVATTEIDNDFDNDFDNDVDNEVDNQVETEVAQAVPYSDFKNSGVSTYPELKVDGWPAGQATAASSADDQMLIDSLVNGYFSSLGAQSLASAPAKREDEDENDNEFAVPFVTFEDMLEIEVETDEDSVVEADEEAPFEDN